NFVNRPFSEPEVSVRPSCNLTRPGIDRRQWKSRQLACRNIATPDAVAALIAEPDIAIGPGSYARGGIGGGKSHLRNSSSRGDEGDLSSRAFSKPDVAVWARSDADGITRGGRC